MTPSDRLAMRSKPAGAPVMEQNWENLLFLHWPVPPAALRPFVPAELEIDTFEGNAWLGVTPFSVTGLRLKILPPVPGLDSFVELNVRTYVHRNGIPGVWFFSLDASKVIPAVAARITYALPYYKAAMDFVQSADQFRFSSDRLGNSAAHFRATWRAGSPQESPSPESLTFFLVERYCLFAQRSDTLTWARIYHVPWTLQDAEIVSLESSMISAAGMPEPAGAPLAHFSRFLNVEIWPPTGLST